MRILVATSFFLFLGVGIATSIRCRDLFPVATSFSYLEPPAGRDSKLLVCFFSCRDVEFRLRPNIFFNRCNSYRDLKGMSRPSLLPIQSQPHFSVSTNSLQFFYFWSRPDCYALFWNICHNLDLMSRHQFLLLVMSIFVATMFFFLIL